MSDEVWHDRGCELIGTTGPLRLTRDDEVGYRLACCGALPAGQHEDDAIRLGTDGPCYLSERRDPPRHVEHPYWAEIDEDERQKRLYGWWLSIDAIADRATRDAVLDSLVGHMARTGQVP